MESENKNAPKMVIPEPTQGKDLLRMNRENDELRRQLAIESFDALAEWITTTAVRQRALEAVIKAKGMVTDAEYAQAIDEAKRSLPEGQQGSDVLGKLRALLQDLSTRR